MSGTFKMMKGIIIKRDNKIVLKASERVGL